MTEATAITALENVSPGAQRIVHLRDDPRYQLLGRSFARGRTTQLYKGREQGAEGRIVAIKRMDHACTRLDAFLLEVQLMQILNRHDPDLPIPIVLHWFGSARAWYLVMSYIEGSTLDALRVRGGPLPVEEVLPLGISLCDTLSALHMQTRPIIHRDIKPANIIRCPDGRVVLTDFGTACFADAPPETLFRGTWAYASPEQRGCQQVGQAADIYALGASLYELLTGRLPRKKDMRGNAQCGPCARLPHALQSLLAQMLEGEACRRPTCMQAVKEVLQQVLMEHILFADDSEEDRVGL